MNRERSRSKPVTVQPGEPLALNPDLQAPFAESDAFRRLKQEMERYVDGRINGGSFLVAGHRGSGKTWAVYKAIESIQFTGRQHNGILTRHFPRPILVRLHGPDLLRSPETPLWNPSTRYHSGRVGASDDPDPNVPFHAMAEITLALHRALCEEVSHSYTEHAWFSSPSRPKAWWKRKKEDDDEGNEAHELAAQLQIELDRSPTPARLLQFWEVLKLRRRGVLNRPKSEARKGEHDLRNPMDQGFRELVALTTAFHVQAEIAHHEREESPLETHSAPKKDNQPAGHEGFWGSFGNFMLTGAHLINPAFGLVIGGVVFVALMQIHVPLATALLTGFLGAVATTILLNFASARAEKSTFLPERTVAALDRTLPLLVRRVREAGLHPVFVVDELDKVDEDVAKLEKKLKDFMKGLRFFVTEQAFFCFLADRQYFNRLMARRLAEPYALEDTFFTEMVFVHYSPKDLHDYLDKMLADKVEVPEPIGMFRKYLDRWKKWRGGHNGPAPMKESLDGAASGPTGSEVTTSSPRRPFLNRLLLFRSRMHPGDLERHVSQLISERESRRDSEVESLFSDDASVLENEGYSVAVFYQLCVEFLMQDSDLKSRLKQDPDFVQSIYDALYYPAREWAKDESDLKIYDKFRRYMLHRRGDLPINADSERLKENPLGVREQPTVRSEGEASLTAEMGSEEATRDSGNRLDYGFLESHMRRVINFLEKPELLEERIAAQLHELLVRRDGDAARNTGTSIKDRAEKSKPLSKSADGHSASQLIDLLHATTNLCNPSEVLRRKEGTENLKGEPEAYIWLRDQYGRSLPSPSADSAPIGVIADLGRFLRSHFGESCDLRLLSELRLMKPMSSWDAINAALDRAAEARNQGTRMQFEEVEELWHVLQGYGSVIRKGLYYGVLSMGTLEGGPDGRSFKDGVNNLMERAALEDDDTTHARISKLDEFYGDHLRGVETSLNRNSDGRLLVAWFDTRDIDGRDISRWLPKIEEVIMIVLDLWKVQKGVTDSPVRHDQQG